MTPIFAILASASPVALLANPAARALVLGAGAGLALWVLRVKATSPRLFTWTAVLYAALAMPLLGWMLPPLPVPTPAFLQIRTVQPAANSVHDAPPEITPTSSSVARDSSVSRNHKAKRTSSTVVRPGSATTAVNPAQSFPSAPVVASSGWPSIAWPSIPWATVATGVYLAVALLLLVRLVVGLVFARRLIRTSQTIHDPRVTVRLASRGRACGLSGVPGIAESSFISVPVTIGALRSTILLPAGWHDWDNSKLDAVVAHELSHVARRDALTQRLSLLHRAIFWFSPLAWWLDRHLADLAEEASDEAALACGTDRNDYARTLLGFFEALHSAPGRVWWQGVSMAKAGQAEQRLERILAWRGAVTMGLKKSIAVAIIALAVPVVYLTASVRPAVQEPRLQDLEGTQEQALPPGAAPIVGVPAPALAGSQSIDGVPDPALAPVAPRSLSTLPPRAISGVVAINGLATVRPVAPVAPLAIMPPPRIWSGQSTGSGDSHGGMSYRYGGEDEQRFVVVSGKSDSYTMSGSTSDIRHVEKLKKTIPGDFIWFQNDEKSYIIRDQATIDRVRKLWAPQEELGKKQEALGKLQEALGKEQEELSARMEKIQVKVPDMTAQLDKLRAELKALSAGATVDQVGKIQEEIGDLQSKIGDIQSHAGDQQSKLGEEMGALGEKQGKLGEQQGELGEEQGKLAEEAAHEMKQILDEALTKGIAQPEP